MVGRAPKGESVAVGWETNNQLLSWGSLVLPVVHGIVLEQSIVALGLHIFATELAYPALLWDILMLYLYLQIMFIGVYLQTQCRYIPFSEGTF